jgi:CubicO group peptidase (beta-lactamase class C family)
MTMEIIGAVEKDRVFCAGSFTKLVTTFVSLSFLAEKFDANNFLDDENFLDSLCANQASRDFLNVFQKTIGSKFTIRDLCNFYAGLPYTFDIAEDELEKVEAGHPFKHHSIPDEKTFLTRCSNNITMIYPDRSKFHYSELAIIFLAYFLEKAFDVKFENLYQKFVIDKFNLKDSKFSRTRGENVFTQDLSPHYDYPSIAILDHGYFCYSNGFFTTLSEMKILLENFLDDVIFQQMVNLTRARAASNRLIDGLTVEIRLVGDDVIYGYEGLSYSGCNIWAYSTKYKKGYLTFTNNEEEAYDIYLEFGYKDFDKAPAACQQIYLKYRGEVDFTKILEKDIPLEFQGDYQRVNINDSTLEDVFVVGKNFIIIRNPEEIRYEVVFVNGHYYVKGKDNLQGTKVGLLTSKSGKRYMGFDGTLYRKI